MGREQKATERADESPATADVGAQHFRPKVSGIRPPLFLLLFLSSLRLLLPQDGAEPLGELGAEVFVGQGQGEKSRGEQRTAGGAAGGAADLQATGKAS